MLTVKKLADLLGLSPEVIRHYTHMGILKPVVNSGNNYKYYDEQDLLYLANIRVNRSLGLSLPQAQDFQSGSVKEQRHLLPVCYCSAMVEVVSVRPFFGQNSKRRIERSELWRPVFG